LSNPTIAKQFIEAMMSSDIEVMAESLDPHVIWYPPTSTASQFHAEIHGLESVISFLTDNPQKFYEPGGRSAEILHIVSENDLVSVHFNFHATPLIGSTLCTCANWMFQFSENNIVAVWEVLDVAEWNNAVLLS